MLGKLIETGLHWASGVLGTHEGQVGLAAMLFLIAWESRHVRDLTRFTSRAGVSLWWFVILLGLMTFGGAAEINVDVLTNWAWELVEFVQSLLSGDIPYV